MKLNALTRTAYSPIPTVAARADERRAAPSAPAGMQLDTDQQLEFVEMEPYVREFLAASDRGARPVVHRPSNGFYERGDVELLHAMVRHSKPRRVLELGAGQSTLVTAAACAANAGPWSPRGVRVGGPGPSRAPHRSCPPADPAGAALADRAPPGALSRAGGGRHPVRRYRPHGHARQRGQLPHPRRAAATRAGRRRAPPGHVLPVRVPRTWLARGTYPSEQYLLRASLISNPTFEVLFATHAVAQTNLERLRSTISTVRRVDHAPSAFWRRRVPLS